MHQWCSYACLVSAAHSFSFGGPAGGGGGVFDPQAAHGEWSGSLDVEPQSSPYLALLGMSALTSMCCVCVVCKTIPTQPNVGKMFMLQS